MENENFKPEESLRLIESMISTAKNKLADDGFYLIFWGWLVFASAMIHYITVLMDIPYGYLVWPVLMPLGGIVSGVYGYKHSKKQKVKTYVDTYLRYLWGSIGIGMAITLFVMPWHGVEQTYFCLMILYGIATFISGGFLNFKPLVYGSLFSFAGAIAAVLNGENEHLLLIISIALLFSYIIPGHLLRAKYKSENV